MDLDSIPSTSTIGTAGNVSLNTTATTKTSKTILHRRGRKESVIVYVYMINIETPLGIKIQVKFRDDMTIQELLNQTCGKLALNPDDYYLSYNNHEIKLELTCLECGLAPNCTVKLFKGRKGNVHYDVQVSIQVKDIRCSSVFRPIDNLWYILKCLCARGTFDKKLVPICIYMKQEFIGKQSMKETTLRDLGVNTGQCLFRFLQIKQEDLDQRKLKDDEGSEGTLESLELIAAGTASDAGARNVVFANIIEERVPSVICFGGRSAVFFEQPQDLDPKGELHDDFFDVTMDEINFMFREYQKASDAIINSNEIKKQVAEVLEKQKQRKSYLDETVIRIYFPNRHVIQSLFAPEESIDEVKAYIMGFLRAPDDFQLYIKPDRITPIPGNQRLAELNMVPTGKLYFDDHVDVRIQYFTREVIYCLSSYENAAEAALAVRGQSLIRFMNYTPAYGGILDRCIDLAVKGFKWIKRLGTESETHKRNKLVPQWLKTDSSDESGDDAERDDRMKSFMYQSYADVFGTEERTSYLSGVSKKPFMVHHKSIIEKEKKRSSEGDRTSKKSIDSRKKSVSQIMSPKI